MPTPRVPMLDLDDSIAAADDVGIPAQLAELNVFRTLLLRPRPAKAVSDLLISMLFGGALDDRLRELVIMRIGWVTGCDYEWTQHWTIAQDSFGCAAEELLAVREWQSSDLFDDIDRAVLEATDEALDSGTVSELTVRRCRDLLGSDDVVVELTLAIGTWQMISHVARSLDIPLEEGVTSWPPDGGRVDGAG